MIKIVEKSNCSGCYSCVQICPKNAIDMISDDEGFWYPEVDFIKCVNCGACEKACPIITPHIPAHDEPIAAYAAMHAKDSIRLKSSSGGVFSALATYILNQGGVVFGACFDEDFNVVHKFIESHDELNQLQGSKYVQSKIDNTYRKAEFFLKQEKLVLFSGTPCQVEGLLSYLRKPYNNLITQDLICHGVPSPTVWQKYIKYRQSVLNYEELQKISFRSKITGWKRYSVHFEFKNGMKYQEMHDKDPMMQVFLKNLCLRPSCYNCSFKAKSRRSDITLADFWGMKNILPDWDDDKGTSLVIIHSDKGHKLFQKITDSITFTEVEPNAAISYNSAMIKSVKLPKKRKAFFNKISSDNFIKVQKKYCKITLLDKAKMIIAKFVGRLKRLLK